MTEARAQRPAPRLARFALLLGIADTLAANVAYGVHFGPVGALVNAWPTAAFITATEILVGQMRRTRPTPAPATAGQTVADVAPDRVPMTVREVEPVTVPASTVPPVPADTTQTVASKRAPKPVGARKAQAPEHVFAAELERSELPSIRAIKSRAKCGTDRARAIREQLSEILREHVPEAA